MAVANDVDGPNGRLNGTKLSEESFALGIAPLQVERDADRPLDSYHPLPSPSASETSSNGFLLPVLSKDEQARLDVLWHFTQGLSEDTELLARLQKTVDLAPRLTGYELAILGLVDSDVFTRAVTVNVPRAVMCRRDSICSHTINIEPNEALVVGDLSADPRFRKSPTAKMGIKAYIGVPITYQNLNLGSLCVASKTVKEEPTQMTLDTLHHLASVLLSDIIAKAFAHREGAQRRMNEAINELATEAAYDSIFEQAITTLEKLFPSHVHISAPTAKHQTLELIGREVRIKDFVDGLWSDVEGIDEQIKHYNHLDPANPVGKKQSYRAIAVKVAFANDDRYLCVESRNLKTVFDSVDYNIVLNVSRLVSGVLQEESLRILRVSKAHFIRGIQHQLRTPLHGILSSSELLREETDRITLSSPHEAEDRKIRGARMKSLLNMVDEAGEFLTTSVNHLIDFDMLQDLSEIKPKKEICQLAVLEREVFATIASTTDQGKLDRLEIIFDDCLDIELDTICTDPTRFKQCLTALITNALDYTEHGSVVISVSSPDNEHVLVYDVQDSGIGIAEEDWGRVFLPFEKVSRFSQHSGLGLAISARLATALSGEVTLVSSTPGEGSHFRFTLNQAALACSADQRFAKVLQDYKAEIPLSYWQPGYRQLETLALTYLCKSLERIGFKQTDRHDATLTVLRPIADQQWQNEVLSDIQAHEIVLCVITSQQEQEAFDKIISANHLRKWQFISVPQTIHRERLIAAIDEARLAFRARQKELPASTLHELDIKSDSQAKAIHKDRKRPLSSLRMLLVDDNAIPLKVLRMFCQRQKYSFECAENGLEAFDVYKASWERQEPMTMIMMDLEMPVMDGFESTRRIRQYEKENAIPPSLIMVVSGLSLDEDKLQAESAGADAYYVKPLSLRNLNDIISYHYSKEG